MTSVLYFLISCAKPIFPEVSADHVEQPIAQAQPFKHHIHFGATQEGLLAVLEEQLPTEGVIKHKKHQYQYSRGSFLLDIQDNHIRFVLPLSIQNIPAWGHADVDVTVQVRPLLTQDYKFLLQDLNIDIQLKGKSLKVLNWFVGIEDFLVSFIEEEVQNADMDIRPLMSELFATYAKPLSFPVGKTEGCIAYNISRIEMDDTKYIRGIEQDMTLTLAPSVTIPCNPLVENASLPVLNHISAVDTGHHEMVIPIAISYEGLRKSLGRIFTDGKFFFSAEHKELYVTEPDIFTVDESLIIKMNLKGKLRSIFSPKIDGAIYFKGTIRIRDNVLTVDEIDTYADTGELLLKLATDLKKQAIILELHKALKFDITQLIAQNKERFSRPYSLLNGKACAKNVIEDVTIDDIFLHKSYVRAYMRGYTSTSIYVPCM